MPHPSTNKKYRPPERRAAFVFLFVGNGGLPLAGTEARIHQAHAHKVIRTHAVDRRRQTHVEHIDAQHDAQNAHGPLGTGGDIEGELRIARAAQRAAVVPCNGLDGLDEGNDMQAGSGQLDRLGVRRDEPGQLLGKKCTGPRLRPP